MTADEVVERVAKELDCHAADVGQELMFGREVVDRNRRARRIVRTICEELGVTAEMVEEVTSAAAVTEHACPCDECMPTVTAMNGLASFASLLLEIADG